MKIFILAAIILLVIACGQQAGNNPKNDSNAGTNTSSVNLNRDNPKPEATQQYEQKVKDDLNNWFFRVKLYETEKRFTYRISLQYEEVSGEDEITFPNLGTDPKPLIKKGAGDYECIIGFMDKEDNFREYKKVHVLDGNLKITTLKSYATTVK